MSATSGWHSSQRRGAAPRAARPRRPALSALSAALLGLLLCAAAHAAEYRIEPLGSLGGSFSRAQGISGLAHICGYAYLSSGVEHAFFHDGTAMHDLGTLGGQAARAYGLNDAGTVVGWAQDAAGNNLPAAWNASGVHELPTLGWPCGTAWGVNAAGRIVGHAYLSASVYHAVRWDGDTVTDLGTLGGATSIAYDVNALGVIAGAADDAGGVQRACLWVGDQPGSIGGLPGCTSSAARAINDLGQAILWNYGLNRAAFWDDGLLTDLGTLGGEQSWAYGLNNLGQVVGWANLASGIYHAFVWADDNGNGLTDTGEMQDLGTLGGLFSSAYAVNDDGIIVGYAQDSSYRWQAVRWVPVPEPATAGVLLSGLAALVARRRKRT